MFNKESVFERSVGVDTLSRNAYNLLIGAVLLWGFAINWYLVATIPVESLLSINKWVFFGGYFVSCIAGIAMFTVSSNPIVSFTGYNLVAVPFGLILNIILAKVDPTIIHAAIQTTALVTFGMMVLGTIFPKFFEKIGTALFWSLLLVIVVQIIQAIFFDTQSTIINWIISLIFCGYIGYDWARANSIPRTVDNAIDSAAALYMDIINLFIQFVQIFIKSK